MKDIGKMLIRCVKHLKVENRSEPSIFFRILVDFFYTIIYNIIGLILLNFKFNISKIVIG